MTDYLEIAKNVKVSAKEAKEAKKGPVPEAPASVTDINTARTIQRGPDERRLIATGPDPKNDRDAGTPPKTPSAGWTAEETDLKNRMLAGETVVANMQKEGHPNLIAWAKAAGLFVRIDRKSDWGNPFEMPDDGDRETVIAKYERYYLPHKPALLDRIGELRGGKILACWCSPKDCHGDVLLGLLRLAAERPAKHSTRGPVDPTEEQERRANPAAVRKLLKDPPDWLRDQIEHARGLGFPETQLKAMSAAVARAVLGDGTRGAEVLPTVEAWLREKMRTEGRTEGRTA